MAQVIALARTRVAPVRDIEWLRVLIVFGCAAALICAKAALPFLPL